MLNYQRVQLWLNASNSPKKLTHFGIVTPIHVPSEVLISYEAVVYPIIPYVFPMILPGTPIIVLARSTNFHRPV